MASRNLESSAAPGRGLPQAGLDVGALQYDQASEPSILQLLQQVLDAAGKVDILVNNAVLRPMGDWSSPAADFAKSMEVNATGLFADHPRVRRAHGRARPRQHHQRRLDSRRGGPRLHALRGLELGSPPDYFFHKGGMVQLTRFAAAKLGPRGVRVNAITPGGFFNHQDPRFVERYNARTFLGRMANESDLKGVIVFLASDASAYVTGANIPVDGGYTCTSKRSSPMQMRPSRVLK